MKKAEIVSLVVVVIGIVMTILAFTNATQTSYYNDDVIFIIPLLVIGMWLLFAGWVSYALAGKGYKRGLNIALGFFTLFGVITAYLLPNKKYTYLKNKYDNLEKISDLKAKGALTEDEYNAEKINILSI